MLKHNLRIGVTWGVCYSIAYSAYAALLAAMGGEGSFRRANTTLSKVLLVYWVAGIGVGALVGLLLPLGRRPGGAAVLGFIGAIPVMLGVGMATEPSTNWLTTVPIDAIGTAAFVGPLAGLGLWWVNSRT